VRDRTLVLASDAGVFSQRGLDKGTAVLLDIMTRSESPVIPDGSLICDIGCGSGPIALALASMYPNCTVIAVDVNERARKLCAENARANKLSNVRVVAPEEVDSEDRYALIWSNPPIRIGKTALHDLLDEWMQRLSPEGHAHLVVSKNLGGDSLAQWLIGRGFATRKLASSKGFRVFEVDARQ
jgi:16S rRNA G1207 methylase RsmC